MTIDESFGKLAQDLTQQVLSQVQQQVADTISETVTQRLNELVTAESIKNIVVTQVNQSLINYKPDMSIFDRNIQRATDRIVTNLNQTVDTKVGEILSTKISGINIQSIIDGYIFNLLDVTNPHYPFRSKSVPGSAIDDSTLSITGSSIIGGTIKDFASTGIDDKATQCQVTILDNGTVFENTLYAPAAEIKGNVIVDGTLLIRGGFPVDSMAFKQIIDDTAESVCNKIGPNFLDQHQNHVFERLRDEGIDLGKITINGQSIIEGNTLTAVIINSQLQTVGMLRDLQTSGETLLSETLYASNRRVGINTMDPNTALSIWDEEVEIGIGKKKLNCVYIGTPKAQTVTLGSNKQDNIVLEVDGYTTIEKLRVGRVTLTSSSNPPTYNAIKGSIVINENPNLGGPLGWVSLGDARWANFGIVD